MKAASAALVTLVVAVVALLAYGAVYAWAAVSVSLSLLQILGGSAG